MKSIDSSWNRFNLRIRRHSGDFSRLPSQNSSIERKSPYHLGCLQKPFEASLLDENMVDNMDNIHFTFNMDNHKTLSFCGRNKVNYAEVVDGCDEFTMI